MKLPRATMGQPKSWQSVAEDSHRPSCHYDKKMYGGEVGEKERQNDQFIVERQNWKNWRRQGTGWWGWPWPAYHQSRVMSGLGCCQGPYLGPWTYHPWPVLMSNIHVAMKGHTDAHGLGSNLWLCCCPKAVPLLVPCRSQWPALPHGAMMLSGPWAIAEGHV